MNLASFIHMYQPYWQHPGVLEKIVNESYRPLIRGFFREPKTKITININSVLTEMLFENGYRDIIDGLKDLVVLKRVELTGSAKYHAFLPLLNESEIERQILLNEETNRRFFGEAYKPKGFFSPEMAYSPKVAGVVKKLGYEWMLLDEVSLYEPGGDLDLNEILEIQGLDLKVYLREKAPSNLVMGAFVRNVESFAKVLEKRINKDIYVITAMDAETYGHHRPGLESLLFEIMAYKPFNNVLISEIPKYFSKVKSVIPKDSSWASSYKDVLEGNPFNYWFDKNNKLHELEWELADLTVRVVNESKYNDKNYPKLLEEIKEWNDMTPSERSSEERKRAWLKVRDMLDKGLNSDPWWWSCAIPWWSLEHLEKGMHHLMLTVAETPEVSDEDARLAKDLYTRILFIAHEWQRTGFVDKLAKKDLQQRQLPLGKRFAAQDYYKAFMIALREEEENSIKNREYEKAIKWRDAQFKLERDLDIYDAVHIIDIFRAEGDFKKFKEILEKVRSEYRQISTGQPE